MAHFLFVDESGQDRSHPRYVVLAGLAVADTQLWNLVRALRDAERRLLGRRYEDFGKEKKGANFLNRKTFLTTGIQLADFAAYIISWGFRLQRMTLPAREELAPYAALVANLRYRAVREKLGGQAFEIWSFKLIGDLRSKEQRVLGGLEDPLDAAEDVGK